MQRVKRLGLNLTEYALGDDLLPGSRAAQHPDTARRCELAAAVQPEHHLAGREHLRLLPRGAGGGPALPRHRFADQTDRQAAAARRRGRQADAESRRRHPGRADRLRRRGGGRVRQHSAVVVHLPHRRHHHRGDAARDLRGRHQARDVTREQRARAEHQRRRPGRALVQLPQGHHDTPPARRGVQPARRACCATSSERP